MQRLSKNSIEGKQVSAVDKHLSSVSLTAGCKDPRLHMQAGPCRGGLGSWRRCWRGCLGQGRHDRNRYGVRCAWVPSWCPSPGGRGCQSNLSPHDRANPCQLMHVRCLCLHLGPQLLPHPTAAEPFQAGSVFGMQLDLLKMLMLLLLKCPGAKRNCLGLIRALPVLNFC